MTGHDRPVSAVLDDCACQSCKGCSTLTPNGVCLDCQAGNHAKDRVEPAGEGR